jgi:hypothetical protein
MQSDRYDRSCTERTRPHAAIGHPAARPRIGTDRTGAVAVTVDVVVGWAPRKSRVMTGANTRVAIVAETETPSVRLLGERRHGRVDMRQ